MSATILSFALVYAQVTLALAACLCAARLIRGETISPQAA